MSTESEEALIARLLDLPVLERADYLRHALMKSGLEAMRHTIREVDPPRPSQRVRTFSEEVRTTVALQRGTNAAKFSLLLRGDLDWIVMHCLEKDRTRRYETASDLAADVRRYLTDEPVAARPPSAVDWFRKFVRRHRLGFIAGIAVMLSLVVGLVMASISLVREHAAREREARLRVEADANAAKSAQVARFMTDMLKGVGPSVALGRDTAMLREILDGTARRLDTELRDQPAVAADLRETLGLVYRDLGQYAAAETLLRDVVTTHRRLFGNESAELARPSTTSAMCCAASTSPLRPKQHCRRRSRSVVNDSVANTRLLPTRSFIYRRFPVPRARQRTRRKCSTKCSQSDAAYSAQSIR
jgi:hypothetical protein